MIRIALLCLTLALSLPMIGNRVEAQDTLDPNPGIEATITGQFDAFAARDIEGAWAYASPTIQSLFGSPENFGRMVEQGYPMVWQHSTVDFIDLQSFGGIIVQRVEVVDRLGTLHVMGYQMVETEDGWLINGVQLLRAPSVGA